jgi:hypothetical protein
VVIACRRSLTREQELQQGQAGDGG